MITTTRRNFLTYAPSIAALTGINPLFASQNANNPTSDIPFKLGLVTYNLGAKFDIPALLRVCKATGISPVELRTTHAHKVEPSLSADERKEVRKKFSDAGVEIWGAGSVCEFHSIDKKKVEENIETCKRFVELVRDIGGKGVKVRPNGLPKEVPVPKTLEQIGKALIHCGKAASDAGVEIWVEVHGPGTAKPENMKTIMEHCGHASVGVTWNSNPDDIKNGSVEESFKMLKPWIKSCHINDIQKNTQGAYPYRELFKLFRQSGYNRVTMIEVGKTLADEASTIEFLQNYKKVWAELASA
jgi:sugar phosphate isomerase/epimerase